jgi:Holliday junction resolvase RusA-like endonuclease
MSLTVTVPGPPVPKGRPRTFWDRRTKTYRTVTPAHTRAFEARVALRFKVAYPHHRPLTGPVHVVLRFHGCARGDADNFAKATIDALNNRAWVDDRQVTRIDVSLFRESDQPRTEIEIYELDADTRMAS